MKLKNMAVVTVILVVMAFAAQVFVGNIAKAQDDGDVMKKLSEIAKAQQAMAADLASIKAELNIIKIRITQQQ